MSVYAAPVVLAAVSGTGKTTLARRLVEGSDRYVFSVSATTRAPRKTERDGIDYHFVSRDRFRAMAERGAFAEWAEVHGRLYGTPRAALLESGERGEHAVLDIDVQGARQIRDNVPGAKLIFVLPPSFEALMERLEGRGTEGSREVARRLRSALEELKAVRDFDHLVVNDELDRCVEEIRAIVEERDFAGPRRDVGFEDVEALRSRIERALEHEYANA